MSFTLSLGASLLATTALSPEVGESEHTRPFGAIFHVPIALCVLWMQALLIFQARCFGG